MAIDYKKFGLGLGLFSVALGVAELIAGRRIARALASEDDAALVRAFGVREAAAGIGLLAAPAHSAMVWNRVLGDAMDLAALAAAAGKRPSNTAVWASLGFVAAATAFDIMTALGLDRTTGKILPLETGGNDQSRAAREPASS
jgi:hypothetical protein